MTSNTSELEFVCCLLPCVPDIQFLLLLWCTATMLTDDETYDDTIKPQWRVATYNYVPEPPEHHTLCCPDDVYKLHRVFPTVNRYVLYTLPQLHCTALDVFKSTRFEAIKVILATRFLHRGFTVDYAKDEFDVRNFSASYQARPHVSAHDHDDVVFVDKFEGSAPHYMREVYFGECLKALRNDKEVEVAWGRVTRQYSELVTERNNILFDIRQAFTVRFIGMGIDIISQEAREFMALKEAEIAALYTKAAAAQKEWQVICQELEDSSLYRVKNK